MSLGEDMTFFEGRMEVLMEQIRNALQYNAEQTERLANALEKLSSCVDERVQGFPNLRINDINYRP
jgi:hypothetical protein